MTADEAREHFSAAYDGELSPADKEAFDRAIEADPELRAEWESFRAMFDGMRALAREDAAAPPPQLLRGVQDKLRARSRGRYYRDRFATRARTSLTTPVLLALLMLLVLGVALFALHYVSVEPSAAPAAPPSSPAPD